MTRFLLGFVAGAALLALVQFAYAPLPTAGNSRPVQPAEPPPAVAATGGPGADAPAAAPEVRGARSFGSDPAPASRADDAADRTSDEDDGDAGPQNPIELPATHAGFVDDQRPSMPEEHSTLENEDVDPGWAELVEELIYSHISTHEHGASIAIVSLVCRTSRCEIAGTVYGERGGETWRNVLSSMRAEPWFASNFSDSALGAGGGMPGEHRFITILARTGTDIAPPVEP